MSSNFSTSQTFPIPEFRDWEKSLKSFSLEPLFPFPVYQGRQWHFSQDDLPSSLMCTYNVEWVIQQILTDIDIDINTYIDIDTTDTDTYNITNTYMLILLLILILTLILILIPLILILILILIWPILISNTDTQQHLGTVASCKIGNSNKSKDEVVSSPCRDYSSQGLPFLFLIHLAEFESCHHHPPCLQLPLLVTTECFIGCANSHSWFLNKWLITSVWRRAISLGSMNTCMMLGYFVSLLRIQTAYPFLHKRVGSWHETRRASQEHCFTTVLKCVSKL